MSISLVNRGCAWRITAYPPTMRYLTPRALKADKRSFCSWNILLHLPTLQGVGGRHHLVGGINTLISGPALPIPVLVHLHLVETRVFAQNRFHPVILASPAS